MHNNIVNTSDSTMTFVCCHCGHEVLSQRGLRQHIDSKPLCLAKERKNLGLTYQCPAANLKKPPPVASIPDRGVEEYAIGEDKDVPSGRFTNYLDPKKPKQSRAWFQRKSKKPRPNEDLNLSTKETDAVQQAVSWPNVDL